MPEPLQAMNLHRLHRAVPRRPAREGAARALRGAVEPSLVGLSRAQLAEALGAVGVPAAQRRMRVQQLWHWLYVRGAALRSDDQRVEGAARDARRPFHAGPARGGGRAGLGRRHAQMAAAPARRAAGRPHEVECVYIPEPDRGTLCVSSQVGCTLTCSFCHTGTQRLVRNLTAGEIVGQVMVARDRLGDWPGKARLRIAGCNSRCGRRAR